MVYVDEMRTFDSRFKGYCHMWTDGDIEELHLFASRMGLRKEWFQNRAGFLHYDVSPKKRELALSRGATFMPLRQWVEQRAKAQQFPQQTVK